MEKLSFSRRRGVAAAEAHLLTLQSASRLLVLKAFKAFKVLKAFKAFKVSRSEVR